MYITVEPLILSRDSVLKELPNCGSIDSIAVRKASLSAWEELSTCST